MGVKFQLSPDRVESKGRRKIIIIIKAEIVYMASFSYRVTARVTPGQLSHSAVKLSTQFGNKNPVRDWEEPTPPIYPVGSINTCNFFT